MQCQFSLEAFLSSGQQGRVGEAKKAEKNYLVSQGLGDKILLEGGGSATNKIGLHPSRHLNQHEMEG